MKRCERRIVLANGTTPILFRPDEEELTAMPSQLVEALRLMSRTTYMGRWLERDIDDEVAATLWTSIQRAEPALHERRPAMRRFHLNGTPFEAFVVIAALAADGMTYSGGKAMRELAADDSIGPAFGRFLRGAVVFASSAFSLPKDFRSLAWLARQPLERGGITALCRHYTSVLQALWYAAQRASGRWPGVFVVTVRGRARLRTWFNHAWTWFCEPQRNRIIPVDLTGADWWLDSGEAPSILNGALDATGFFNVSAFAANMIAQYSEHGQPGYRNAEIRAVLRGMVGTDPASGRLLLRNLHFHPGLDGTALEAITEQVGRRRARVIPSPVMGDAVLQRELVHEMLAALQEPSSGPPGADSPGWGYRSTP